MLVCATGNTVTPTDGHACPCAAMADFERYEGMRVHFSQTLTATETFTLGRFGEVRLVRRRPPLHADRGDHAGRRGDRPGRT